MYIFLKVEPGYFFGPDGGRINAFRRFRVGIDFDVSLWIKPRNVSGLLLAVRGRRDMVILQMVDGAIQFSVDNGRGLINAIFKPDERHQFCNGEWHEIHGKKELNHLVPYVNLAIDPYLRKGTLKQSSRGPFLHDVALNYQFNYLSISFT